MINSIDLYGKEILYSVKGNLVCWIIKGDIFKRYNTLNEFSRILNVKNTNIEALNFKEVDNIKKQKIFNKNNKYIGIDKLNNRIIYYDKTRMKIAKENNWNKCVVAFYFPIIDLDLLYNICNGNYFEMSNFVYKILNTENIKMDIDTFKFILEIVHKNK